MEMLSLLNFVTGLRPQNWPGDAVTSKNGIFEPAPLCAGLVVDVVADVTFVPSLFVLAPAAVTSIS